MKFVLAPDSFKGSLTAKQAAAAMHRGLSRIFPDAEFELIPMADGGLGTAQALVDSRQGSMHQVTVMDPTMTPTVAAYGVIDDGKTAIIEVAAASGIENLDPDKRNPLVTTTYGTGQLIKDALDTGVTRIILAVGGSATNDGGEGMLEALGVKFLDAKGQPIPRGGGGLAQLALIDANDLDPRFSKVTMSIATDSLNPLVGQDGTSAVYAPNKGATPAMVAELDANLAHYAEVLKRTTGKDVANMSGAGSSGGLAAGVFAFTDTTVERGVDLVAKVAKLDERVAGAAYVLTGEGMVDDQTQFGKTPLGVAIWANKGNPQTHVIVIGGGVEDGIDELYNIGVDAIFSMAPGEGDLQTAMANAAINLERTTENVGRLIRVVQLEDRDSK